MSVSDFKRRVHAALLNLLWRQWTRLGVPGHGAGGQGAYVLDPEALLAFSSRLARYDQRLFDLLIDWLRINGDYINIQRLKASALKSPSVDAAALGAIAGHMSATCGRKWQKLANDLLPAKNAPPTPLFLHLDPPAGDFVRDQDPLALRYGFVRNLYRPPGKTTPFPLNDGASLLLQLRGMFGLSARAETVLILLNHDSCKIQDIADLSGFAWKSIQDALTELSASPLVVSHSGAKRGSRFALKNPGKFRVLLDAQSVLFPDWRRVFDALAVLWTTIANPRLTSLSEQTFNSEIKRVFADAIGETFLHAGVSELKYLSPASIAELPAALDRID